MRILSQAIKDVLAAEFGETHDIVVLTIPANPELSIPETTLYLANGEGIAVDGQVYQNRLRAISTIKFSMGAAPDNAQITIENVSRDLGFILTDTQRIIDGSEVIIKRAFKIADGTYESDTMFVGQVRNISVTQDAIQLTIHSDMSKRGSKVAGRTITQRCLAVFNVNGSGIGKLCGWQTSQPGNALECDKDRESPNGCASHGNLHRFLAVPAFTAYNEGNGYDNNTGGGWGTGIGSWCVHPDTWILCAGEKGNFWVRAYNLKAGETLLSRDKFGDPVKTQLVEAVKGSTTKIYHITSKMGFGLSCSPSHPIIRDFNDDIGTPADTLKVGDKILVFDEKKNFFIEDFVDSIESYESNCSVIMLKLEEPYHLFVSGNTKNGGIVSHNNKPVFPIDRLGYNDTRVNMNSI